MLTNGSGNHAINIAEHVLALMLAFARQLPALVRAQDERQWRPPKIETLFELSGQTLAVVGAGALGCAVAARAAAFGMRVLGVRRTPDGTLPPGFASMAALADLDAVLAEADHVVITLPLTAETRGLFSTARLAAMKPGAHLYNVGRGAIVDPAALLAALRSGRLAGAGLDVTDPEPLPADSPLWSEPGVIVTRALVGPDAALVAALRGAAAREHPPLPARRAAPQRRRQAARLLSVPVAGAHFFADGRRGRRRQRRGHLVLHRRDRLQVGEDRVEVGVVEVPVGGNRHRRQDLAADAQMLAEAHRVGELLRAPAAEAGASRA